MSLTNTYYLYTAGAMDREREGGKKGGGGGTQSTTAQSKSASGGLCADDAFCFFPLSLRHLITFLHRQNSQRYDCDKEICFINHVSTTNK